MTPKVTSNPRLPTLRKLVAKAPLSPGIYRWLDSEGTVLYVGKAKNLRNRLRSYVQDKTGAGPWKQSFTERIADFDVTVCTTELEALLLETNLIKELRPKYNVLMKDDKNYLFVRISLSETYPRIETVRRMAHDKAKYFGPYLSSYELHQTLDMLHEVYGYRACKESLEILNRDPTRSPETLRACLDSQIGRCCGLCCGKITPEEYRSRIEKVMEFLKGKREPVKKILSEQMKSAAAEQKFERAATLRNYLKMLEEKPEEQLATDTTGEDSDVIGVAVLSSRAHVVILHRRGGRLTGESHYALAGQAESAASVLEQFLPQYYEEGREIPGMIFLPDVLEEGEAFEALLKERRGKSVSLLVPERGRKSHLLLLAEKNAQEKARQQELKWETEERNRTDALATLQQLLELPAPPKRIEGYDISHLGGTETVGSMVVLRDGKTANDHYRSFTIRTLEEGEIDDYASMREVLKRRLRRLTDDIPAEEAEWKKEGITFGKGVKKEQKLIEEIHAAHQSEMSDKEIDCKTYVVARKEGVIVGFGRLFCHPGKIVELKSIWVHQDLRGSRLGQFIARKILRTVKKGKIYLTIVPELEQYYAEIGFRYVITPPKVLTEEMEEEKKKFPETPMGIAMMWEAHQNKVDPSLSTTPDLLVIDGGKGQLGAVVEVLKESKFTIPVIGLAKREEEIFVPGKAQPVPFPPDSSAKFLLMRLRDEAHRFANRHREGRGLKAMKQSALDDLPGIGDSTRDALMKKFGSLDGIRAASDNELGELLSDRQIDSVREFLKT